MNGKLNSRQIRLQDSKTSNKRRYSEKQWWTEEQSQLWNSVYSAEKKRRNEAGRRKIELKTMYLNLKKNI